MTNRLPAEELLQVIQISRAEQRGADQPRRTSDDDLGVTRRQSTWSELREERRPACEGTSSLAPRGV